METNSNKTSSKSPLQRQVSEFFAKKSLSPTSRAQILALLDATTVAPSPSPNKSYLGRSSHKAWMSPLISAALAASVTFLLVAPPSPDETLDPIAELAQLPGPKVYPPDFDLEGDSKAMNDIVYELFADKNFFVSDLPAQVLADYQPNEGRFFSWDGEPAVSIQMNQNANQKVKKPAGPATLLIVKLSEKSQRKFPKEKETRKVTAKSGKTRKVKVWREGNFGYAMVQDSGTIYDTP